MNKSKTVFGIGINDADYKTSRTVRVEGKSIRIWICPFYAKWKDMLMRCYSEKYKATHPTYEGCYVSREWLTFSNFKSWMEKQDWEGKQLDKDILRPQNKCYSDETCVFVDPAVNYFFTDRISVSDGLLVGACYHKTAKKFIASCKDVTTNKIKHLGYFTNALDAHYAWLISKIEQANILASNQSDSRVAEALLNLYENYKEGKHDA